MPVPRTRPRLTRPHPTGSIARVPDNQHEGYLDRLLSAPQDWSMANIQNVESLALSQEIVVVSL